ncbi:MAG: hypothetical protein KA052_01700 [Candidatus Pacebacteria bacterium]|nr:hypothetical protein [Candidatus Paceibacterota bacterium]
MEELITWLHFLAIENKVRAILGIGKKYVENSTVNFYSLSDNTMTDYWQIEDPDGLLDINYNLLFSAKIHFGCNSTGTFDHVLKDSYIRIELFPNGVLECRTFISVNYANLDSDPEEEIVIKLLEKGSSEKTCKIPIGELQKFLEALRDVFCILNEFVYRVNKFHGNLDAKRISAIKKYVIGKPDAD